MLPLNFNYYYYYCYYKLSILVGKKIAWSCEHYFLLFFHFHISTMVTETPCSLNLWSTGRHKAWKQSGAFLPLGGAEELRWDFVEIFINSFRRLQRNFRTNYSVHFMTMWHCVLLFPCRISHVTDFALLSLLSWMRASLFSHSCLSGRNMITRRLVEIRSM